MDRVAGVKGYERDVEAFAAASRDLEFEQIHGDFLNFLPPAPVRVLDAGCGTGSSAVALADKGYEVVAVEPFAPFLDIAKQNNPGSPVLWLEDSLPLLAKLEKEAFDFILVSAVWHHLDDRERASALKRLAGLLGQGGRCAISLRNGPPGLGTHVFPTDAQFTVRQAAELGMQNLFCAENLPSKLPNKADVVWARVVLEKC